MMNADLVLGWTALVSAYNVVVPDLAAQAKGYLRQADIHSLGSGG